MIDRTSEFTEMTTPTFRYFRDPHHFSTYTAGAATLRHLRPHPPRYEGPFYSEQDLDFVCEPCLASGRLCPAHTTANKLDRQALYQQIQVTNPTLSEDKSNPS